MAIEIDIQQMMVTAAPSTAQLKRWVSATLTGREHAELTIRIVDVAEMTELNHRYRQKNHPTNVLSFPFTAPACVTECHLLGDIVICAPVVASQAQTQQKNPPAHWAHMVVHGVLHLLGYDHQLDQEAEIMETLEVKILATLGYPNPYYEAVL